MANTETTSNSRHDPIRPTYFEPLERAETASGWLFYICAAASFVPLLINKETNANWYEGTLVAFFLLTLASFVLNNTVRLYLFPRAEDARRGDFISHAFGFSLADARTRGYYNNSETEPLRKFEVATLENLYFTKSILRKMATRERTKFVIYALLWFGVLFSRGTPYDWLAITIQLFFSEEIVARILRFEWARNRVERLYDQMHALLQSHGHSERTPAYALKIFGEYETGKATSGILLSGKIFNQLNDSLSAEWEEVKGDLLATTENSSKI